MKLLKCMLLLAALFNLTRAVEVDPKNLLTTPNAFIIGGDFSAEVNGTSATHLAFWVNSGDEGVWGSLGSPNGPVHAMARPLSCPRLYVAGDFTEIGGVATGPVARLKDGKWESVLGEETVDGTIQAIDVDCINVGVCDCDVYIGGSFATINNGTTTVDNIAVLHHEDTQLKPIGGGLPGGPVLDIVKRSTLTNKYLYAVGDFDGKVARVDTKADTATFEKLGEEFDGAVRSIAYKYNNIKDDQVFVGGDFSKPHKNVAMLQTDGDKYSWESVGTSDISAVNALSLNGDNLVQVGSSKGYISRIDVDQRASASWSTVAGDDASAITGPLNAVYECSVEDVGCRRGNMVVGGVKSSGFSGVKFYDAKKGAWKDIGGAFGAGQVYSVLYGSSASALALPVLLLGVLLALLF